MKDKKTCPECDGKGWIWYGDINNEKQEKDTCPICNGDGIIEKEKMKIIKSETIDEYIKDTVKLINKE